MINSLRDPLRVISLRVCVAVKSSHPQSLMWQSWRHWVSILVELPINRLIKISWFWVIRSQRPGYNDQSTDRASLPVIWIGSDTFIPHADIFIFCFFLILQNLVLLAITVFVSVLKITFINWLFDSNAHRYYDKCKNVRFCHFWVTIWMQIFESTKVMQSYM